MTRSNFELICWISALLLLYFLPFDDRNSLCFFSRAGITVCPGCGIGHSINDALHFRFSESYSHHFFGIPAVLIIIYRIKDLTFRTKNKTAKQ